MLYRALTAGVLLSAVAVIVLYSAMVDGVLLLEYGCAVAVVTGREGRDSQTVTLFQSRNHRYRVSDRAQVSQFESRVPPRNIKKSTQIRL